MCPLLAVAGKNMHFVSKIMVYCHCERLLSFPSNAPHYYKHASILTAYASPRNADNSHFFGFNFT